MPKPLVEVALVEPHTEGIDFEVDGVVVPFRQVEVPAEVPGRIAYRSDNCRVGRTVARGELLLKIDSQDYELEVRRLEETLREAQASLRELMVETESRGRQIELAREDLAIKQREVARYERIEDPGVYSKSELDTARLRELQARAALQTERDQLSLLEARHARLTIACELVSRQLEKAQLNLHRTDIMITVPYPGAAPEEVEEGICQKIEEAVRSISGIKKVTSTASEGMGSVTLELESGVRDANLVLDDVKSAVDQIPTFPEKAERHECKLAQIQEVVLQVGVVGPDRRGAEAELQLREVAERVRDELLLLPEVSQVNLTGAKDYQIDIEIPEATLRSHGLSLREVAQRVRRENHQLPAGTIRAKSQEVLVRGYNRRLWGDDIARLPVVTTPEGAVLTVGDLGLVRDELTDSTNVSEYNGRPVLVLGVLRNTNEDVLKIADAVHQYVAAAGYLHFAGQTRCSL